MDPEEDLPTEAVEAAKRKGRINALVLALVFLLLSFAPRPWSTFAPLLFLIPVIYSLVIKMRSGSHPAGTAAERFAPPPGSSSSSPQPFSYQPRDPKDPRRYKPIG